VPHNPSFQSKVLRLLAEGSVVPDVAPDPQLFWVDGDTPGSRYAVVVGAHVQMCSCRAVTRCTHIEAAVARVNASDAARELMDQALLERRARDAAKAEGAFARLSA
jgi:hypothetical protein